MNKLQNGQETLKFKWTIAKCVAGQRTANLFNEFLVLSRELIQVCWGFSQLSAVQKMSFNVEIIFMLLYHIQKAAPCERQLAWIIKSLTFLPILIPKNLLESLQTPQSQEDTLPRFPQILLRSSCNSQGKNSNNQARSWWRRARNPQKYPHKNSD